MLVAIYTYFAQYASPHTRQTTDLCVHSMLLYSKDMWQPRSFFYINGFAMVADIVAQTSWVIIVLCCFD